MRDNISTYKIWAPDDALWTGWAKPVLFANPPFLDTTPLELPPVPWAAAANYSSMVVVDLPGEQGVLEGLALARSGYRPVPLYNGVHGGDHCIVQVGGIVSALFRGAEELARLPLRLDAPPAFLLDFDRMKGRGKQAGKYDNRWCIFPQDMPSAGFLTGRGINRVIVRAPRIQEDLSHILCRYQEQGIQIQLCDSTLRPREELVRKPTRFKSAMYRYSVMAGLTRNATGGFGGMVPEPTQSTGVRYYGHG